MNSEAPRLHFQHVLSGELVEYAVAVDDEALDRIARAELRREAADAVIAHLWQRAESPDVVEAVRDRIKSIANDPHIKDRYQMYAEVILEDVLTELIGPKPEGENHER